MHIKENDNCLDKDRVVFLNAEQFEKFKFVSERFRKKAKSEFFPENESDQEESTQFLQQGRIDQ